MPVRPQQDRRRVRRGLLAAVPVALLAVLVALVPPTQAVFTATSPNSGNSVTAAATFPNYPTQVGSGPRFHHRGDEDPVATTGSAAADSSGHTLPGTYDGTTDGPSTWWKFDESSGTAAADASGAADPATVTNGGATAAPGWTTGRRGGAVSLDGVDDVVVGARAAVDTAESSSLSAWVYLTSTTVDRYAAAQEGTQQSGLALQYLKSCNCWAARATSNDNVSTTVTSASTSSPAAVTSTWVHLTAVRDTSAGQLRMYVNGVAAGSSAYSATWSASGSLEVGRARVNGAYGGYWAGRVDEVKTWRRALSATEVRDEFNGRSRGFWAFEEGSGTTAGTSSDTVSMPMTLRGSVAWQNNGDGTKSLKFPGATTGYVDRAAVLNTDRSFTVMAWVYATTLNGAFRVVLSQDGSQVSGYYLEYVDDAKRWAFTMLDSDTTGAGGARAVSTSTPALNTWTHLTGVYDAEADELRLYVNWTLESTVNRTASWNATGSFKVGQGWSGAAAVNPFTGYIDDVRAFQRAMSGTAVNDARSTGQSDVTPTGFTARLPGALDGVDQAVTPNRAVAFTGSTSLANPQLYTAAQADTSTTEYWVRTTGTGGGVLSTFANQTSGTTAAGSPTGTGGSSDRTTYVDSGGRVSYVVKDGSGTLHTLRSPQVVNDGQWHHVASSLGAAGAKLHVDGVLVGQDTGVTAGQSFSGYWRFGGGRVDPAYSNQPTRQFLTGTLDEMAVYPTQLTDLDITHHFFSNF